VDLPLVPRPEADEGGRDVRGSGGEGAPDARAARRARRASALTRESAGDSEDADVGDLAVVPCGAAVSWHVPRNRLGHVPM
jgi:hypothetical protein